MMEALQNEVLRSRRLRHGFAVLMIDVDHFKSYNDSYGHPAGDEVLKRVANTLREAARDVDWVARYGAATGMGFVLLVLIGFAIQPSPPSSDASPSEVLNYVVDHQNALHANQLIFGVAGLLFVWFIGTLRSYLATAEGGPGRLAGTAYGAGIAALTVLIVSFGLTAAAAFHPAANGPGTTRALVDAGFMIAAVGAPVAAAFLFANGLVVMRTDVLPAYLGWLAVVAGAINLLGLGAVYTDSGAFAPDGVFGLVLPFISFLLWVLLTSMEMVRRMGRADAGARAEPVRA
jgi:hypothetical protein